jgi:hypothetical protein
MDKKRGMDLKIVENQKMSLMNQIVMAQEIASLA